MFHSLNGTTKIRCSNSTIWELCSLTFLHTVTMISCICLFNLKLEPGESQLSIMTGKMREDTAILPLSNAKKKRNVRATIKAHQMSCLVL